MHGIKEGVWGAGEPHAIKEENYLLFGVVEEKAQKAGKPVISFDFWTIRRHVLFDRDTNAAVVLQSTWRGAKERRAAAELKAKRQWGRTRGTLAAVDLLAGRRPPAADGRGAPPPPPPPEGLMQLELPEGSGDAAGGLGVGSFEA